MFRNLLWLRVDRVYRDCKRQLSNLQSGTATDSSWPAAAAGRLAFARRLSAPLFRHFLGARIEKLPKEDRYASRNQAGVFLGGLHGL